MCFIIPHVCFFQAEILPYQEFEREIMLWEVFANFADLTVWLISLVSVWLAECWWWPLWLYALFFSPNIGIGFYANVNCDNLVVIK